MHDTFSKFIISHEANKSPPMHYHIPKDPELNLTSC